jgi:hypothetical protein
VSVNELPASQQLPRDTSAIPGGEREPSSTRARIVFVAVCAAAGVLLAVPAGWLWARLADPPVGVAFQGAVYYGELQLNLQSEITLWFLAVGFCFGLVAGLVIGALGGRHGVVTVVAVLALCGLAAWLTKWTGLHWFGPDSAAELAKAKDGDPVTGGLEVATWVAFLGWPIGGMVGALATISTWPQPSPQVPPPVPPPSPQSPAR